MLRTVALIACLALAWALASAVSRPPRARPADAPVAEFAAGRAFRDVQAIGAKPHPMGSAEHDRVLQFLAERCRGLGLLTRLQAGQAIERSQGPNTLFVEGGEVRNLVCTLPGRDRSAPAVALMAHYDTVPASPGAADDSTGVAAALETVRALMASGRPARDVVVLITDGEEGGLLGARAFFGLDPLARHIGAAINMEAHGGGGRVYMFQTGADNGGMIDLFRRSAANPTAASLSGFVYAHMPADTDFTIARAHGITGFNFAFMGRPFDYHAASSTPEALDQGSLQHMGDQVLAAARALAGAQALPAPAPDAVYADLLGGPMAAYPPWAGWLVLIGAAALLAISFRRAFEREPFAVVSSLRGALALILTGAFVAALLLLARIGVDIGSSFTQEKALLARFHFYEGALGAACVGGAVLSFVLLGAGRTRFWSAFAGASAVATALAALLQAAAPLTAYLVAWPLLAAGVIAWALAFRWNGARTPITARIFAAAAALIPLAQIVYTAHPVALSVGAQLPEALAVFAVLGALVLFPLLWPDSGHRATLAVGVLALLAAVGLVLGLRFGAPWSARHPRPTEVVYGVDLTSGAFLRASPLQGLDPWTARVLATDGAPIRLTSMSPFSARAYAGPGWPIAFPRPDLLQTRRRAKITLKLTAGGSPRDIYLEFSASAPITKLALNGMALGDLQPGRWTVIEWHGPKGPLNVAFDSAAAAALQARYAEVIDGWPPEPKRLPPLPQDAMVWRDGGSTVLFGAARDRWEAWPGLVPARAVGH